MNYNQDKRLKDLLEDKRIAFVGPSKHLEGCGHGKIFEEYDLICRVNEFFPFGLEEDYGNRTDLIFHNINRDASVILKNELARDIQKTLNLKFIICPQKGHDDTGLDIVRNFEKLNYFNIPFHHIGDPYYFYIAKKIKTKPNTGIMSIITLLNYGIKELFLTGFSFYSQGPLIKQCHRSNYPSLIVAKYTTGHNQIPQIKFFKNVILKEKNDVIVIDDFLDRLLGINYNKVKKLVTI